MHSIVASGVTRPRVKPQMVGTASSRIRRKMTRVGEDRIDCGLPVSGPFGERENFLRMRQGFIDPEMMSDLRFSERLQYLPICAAAPRSCYADC
jgi:hypothetical protein